MRNANNFDDLLRDLRERLVDFYASVFPRVAFFLTIKFDDNMQI